MNTALANEKPQPKTFKDVPVYNGGFNANAVTARSLAKKLDVEADIVVMTYSSNDKFMHYVFLTLKRIREKGHSVVAFAGPRDASPNIEFIVDGMFVPSSLDFSLNSDLQYNLALELSRIGGWSDSEIVTIDERLASADRKIGAYQTMFKFYKVDSTQYQSAITEFRNLDSIVAKYNAWADLSTKLEVYMDDVERNWLEGLYEFATIDSRFNIYISDFKNVEKLPLSRVDILFKRNEIFDLALVSLDEYLAEKDRELEVYDREIKKAEEGLDAINELERLYEGNKTKK